MTEDQPSQPVAAPQKVVVPPAKKSNNKVLYIVLAVVLVVFVLPGIALGVGLKFLASKASDKIAERGVESALSSATGGKVDVSSKDGSFSVQSKNGDSSIAIGGSNQKLPSDFPKSDIPYLAESGVSAVFTSSTSGKKSWSVSTTVSKSFDEAKSYFEGKIKEPEYTDVGAFGSNGSQLISGKNAKYSVTVTISEGKDGEKTSVQYIVSQQ